MGKNKLTRTGPNAAAEEEKDEERRRQQQLAKFLKKQNDWLARKGVVPSMIANVSGPFSSCQFFYPEDEFKYDHTRDSCYINDPPPTELLQVWQESRNWLVWDPEAGLVCTARRGLNESSCALGVKAGMLAVGLLSIAKPILAPSFRQ